jgi:glycosyltransferase involved in cell wall biosynthesis
MTNLLSIVIITKNEEKFIEDSIKSADFADEVLILDCGSTDNTCKIAKKMGARVENQTWLGFGPQKNKAVDLATHDWVFVLDADERIPSKLCSEIISILKNPSFDGYSVARLNNFFGKDIKTCGLYPDYTIRLYNRRKGRFNNVPIHESVQIEGKVSKLMNHMIHLAYEDVDEFINKQRNYAKLSNKKKNILKAFVSPCWTFFKLYFLKLGFLDGWHGYIIAKIYAKYAFWRYRKCD